MLGEVKFFNKKKGWGFIGSDSLSADVFVHHTGLKEEIRSGDRVSFELSENNQGSIAINVKKCR